ncbi:E3 ubiquitin-protein ligase MARCH4 [Rhinatrema bivittatum]|uniref:E3 ubiquitin-protein ligase MARCH4 n=1 Tax=Rhinatrema bivittatum TaxID=194408 RepID=UPI00112AC64F|nr:E3 ubiquitin-protein ligase MARCH4 [Rhinatrema bivittatum]
MASKKKNLDLAQFSYTKTHESPEAPVTEQAANKTPDSDSDHAAPASLSDLITRAELREWFIDLRKDLKQHKQDLLQSIIEVREELAAVGHRVDDLDVRVEQHEMGLNKMADETTQIQADMKSLFEKVEDLENRSRHNNIRIKGVPETPAYEDCTTVVTKIFNFLLADPERVHHQRLRLQLRRFTNSGLKLRTFYTKQDNGPKSSTTLITEQHLNLSQEMRFGSLKLRLKNSISFGNKPKALYKRKDKGPRDVMALITKQHPNSNQETRSASGGKEGSRSPTPPPLLRAAHMLASAGALSRGCRGLRAAGRMLRPPGLLKCRGRLLFDDLKLFLLGRPRAPAPPMPGAEEGEGEEAAANNNNSWRSAPAGGAAPPPPALLGSAAAAAADECWKGRADDRHSLGSSIDSGMRTPLCRICFQGPEQGELLSPCRCDGSVRCTHQPCLIKWISERGSWSCELCYYKYHVIAISTKNPLQVKWQTISLTVIERVQIAAAILGSLFLIASISWLIWSTFSPSAKWQRQDLLFQICYGMYGFMDVVCIGLIIHEGPSVYRIFKRWQAVNQQWKVLNYEKTKDVEDQKMGTSRTNQPPSSQTNHSSSSAGDAANSVAPADGNGPAASLSDHHCAYTILHILSHLRPHEQRSRSGTNRELVMRVTTV